MSRRYQKFAVFFPTVLNHRHHRTSKDCMHWRTLFSTQYYQYNNHNRLLLTRRDFCLFTERLQSQNNTDNSSNNATASTCWQCNQTLSSTKTASSSSAKENRFFCPACGVILPPNKSINLFGLLNQPTSYSIDLENLTQLRNRLQMQLHPDRFHGKSSREADYSAEQSSLINSAFNVLTDPFKRGDYLLEVLGAGKIDENSLQGSVEFLSEIMELNESIAADDVSASQLKDFKRENIARLSVLEDEIEKAFDNNNNVAEARILLCKMKYYRNVHEKLKDAQLRLELQEKK